MTSLLHRFAALTLVLIFLRTLLPEGTMRRTAMLCIGFITILCLLDGLQQFPSLSTLAAPDTILTDTAASAGDLDAALTVYARQAERLQHEQ